MKVEWVSLVISVGAGVVASLVSSFAVARLKRKDDVIYDVTFSSGKRHEVKVSKSLTGDDIDSSVQEAILSVLTSAGNFPKSQDELRKLIDELERQRVINPSSPALINALARAYRRVGEVRKAIDLLSEYISSRRPGPQRDKALGIAYYNRACYRALEGKESLALEDLSKAFSLHPGLATAAVADVDLIPIRERLKEILPAEPVN
jgi:tetratricopeptide (TPR) repeat protein